MKSLGAQIFSTYFNTDLLFEANYQFLLIYKMKVTYWFLKCFVSKSIKAIKVR